MFTGLIESVARVIENEPHQSGRRLTIEANFDGIQSGESIAINGVCLTVLPNHGSQRLSFDLSPETLALTTLETLASEQKVNVERALVANSRMGGHYVSGHVDTTAKIRSLKEIGEFIELSIGDFNMPASAYLLPKGSITLDGISLTINSAEAEEITVMLVPHTLSMTTFSELKIGQKVNVEFDYLARIVAHQLASFMPRAGII